MSMTISVAVRNATSPRSSPKPRVDISGKGVEELVDDGHVIHGVSFGSAGTAGAMPPSAGSSKLGGIGGRSASVWYSSGPAWPGEEAPPEGFGGGAASVLARGLPVVRALRAQCSQSRKGSAAKASAR